MSSRKICLDTNVLLTALTQKPNCAEAIREEFGSQCVIAIPLQVKHELESLSKSNKKLLKNARISKQVLRFVGVVEKKVEAKNADDALRVMAKKGFVVVTLDAQLRNQIRKEGGVAWGLSGKRLVFDN